MVRSAAMSRNLLLVAVAAFGLAAALTFLLGRAGPVTWLDLRIALRSGQQQRVEVDGTAVRANETPFDLYANTTRLPPGDRTLDVALLRRLGRPAPPRDLAPQPGAPRLLEPTVDEIEKTLREHLGLVGGLLVPPGTAPGGRLEGWFEVADPSDRSRDLLVSCRMKELDWRTPDGGLDNFVLVDFQQAGTGGDAAPERWLVLLRLRDGRDGAYISGHSASARPGIERDRMQVDAEFQFVVHPVVLGGAAAKAGVVPLRSVEGVDHWWVAQFPPGAALVR